MRRVNDVEADVRRVFDKVDNTSDMDKPISTAQRITLNTLEGNGVVSGMLVTINSDNTKIDIAPGIYHILGNGNITFPGLSGVSITNLATASATYVGVNASHEVVQQITPFTPAQRRQIIILAVVIHSNRLYINVINFLPDVAIAAAAQLYDLYEGFGIFNKEGNKITANGANLFINKSAGELVKKGINFAYDVNNPNIRLMPELIAPSTIRYRLADGTEYPDTQSIDLSYESSPGVKTALGNNQYSTQRIVIFPSNLIRIQYGQHAYGSMSLAIQSINSETFVQESNMQKNGLILCFLVVRGGVNTISLLDPARVAFIPADRFGQVPSGSEGGLTSLQQAYNNSVNPEVLTNADLGAVSFKRGSAADTDTVIEVLNGAGTNVASISGEGKVVGSSGKFGTSSNNTEFEADGSLKFNGTATTFNDFSSSVINLQKVGTGVSDNLAENTVDFAVTSNMGDYIAASLQLTHSWKIGSNLYPHLHYIQTTVGNPNLLIQYRWQSLGEAKQTSWTNLPCVTPVITYVSGSMNQIVYTTPIIPPAYGKLSDIIQFRIVRDNANTSLAFAGVDPVNATIAITSFDLHMELDSIGSRQEYIK